MVGIFLYFCIMLVWDKYTNDWRPDNFIKNFIDDDDNDFEPTPLPKPAPLTSPASTPYYIKLVNTCTSAVSSVDIGGAWRGFDSIKRLWTGQNANITYTIPLGTTSYDGLMGSLTGKPFLINKIGFQWTPKAGYNPTITILHNDMNGDEKIKIVSTAIDPHQVQNDIINIEYTFPMDIFTTIRISSLLASSTGTVFVKLYPTAVIKPEFDAYWEWYLSQPFVLLPTVL